MKGIIVLRMLIAIPLIGVVLPDLTFKLSDQAYIIPPSHYYVCILLAFSYLMLKARPLQRYLKRA